MNDEMNTERDLVPEELHIDDPSASDEKTGSHTASDVADAREEGEEQPTADQTEQPAEEQPAEEQPAEEQPEKEAFDSFGKRIVKPYHERAYLFYGGNELKESLDPDGTIAFLREIGFDGGEMRKARKGRYYSERNKEPANADSRYCSYCSREISGVDYYSLPDGRLRCTSCSRTLIRTREEVIEIYKRVIQNMEMFFNATIRVPVGVELLEERQLKRKLKKAVGDFDDKSFLILGLAVDCKKEYDIYLENGAPRISVIATFVHELTHIWQYTHWGKEKSFPKLTGQKHLLVYEGMAKWAEIQYLYLIGEQSVAKRDEALTRERKDEYGLGFLLYENKYPLSREVMLCNDTPFKTSGYPIF